MQEPRGCASHTGGGGFLGRQGSLAASLATFKLLHSIHASGVTGAKLLLKFIYYSLEEKKLKNRTGNIVSLFKKK